MNEQYFTSLNGYYVKDKEAIHTYDSVAEMKADSKIREGSYVKTRGYYNPNDGGQGEYIIVDDDTLVDDGGSIHVLSNGLRARLIIENDTINVKQFGATTNGSDNSVIFQKALNYANIIKIPEGEYYINSKLYMRENTELIGINSNKTKIIVGENLTNDYIIEYCDSYIYSAKRGVIKNIRFLSNDTKKSKGILLNGGLKVINCIFFNLKCALIKNPSYIDEIEIINTAIDYCSGTAENYVLDFRGNFDALKIDTLTIADNYTDTEDTTSQFYFTKYRGINIQGCTGGYIKNSIINENIIINNCKAFTIENTHIEGSQGANYKGNLAYIQINNSCVSIKDCLIFKRSNGANILVTNEDVSNQSSNTVTLENIFFIIRSGLLHLFNLNPSPYEIKKDKRTFLKIKNCFKNIAFGESWTTSNEIVGIKIEDNEKFNEHSSYFSYNAEIDIDNNVLNNVNELRDIYVNDEYLPYSISNGNIPFYQPNFDNKTQYINCVICFDWTRKLAVARSTSEKTITGVTTTTNENNGKGIMIRQPRTTFDSNGLSLIYYRGDNSGSYNKITKIPIANAYFLFDMGTNVSGITTEDREAGGIDNFNYVKKCKTVGDNVEFYSSSTPEYGTFKKFDRCINSNISSGNVKSWIYDGTNWISEGNY